MEINPLPILLPWTPHWHYTRYCYYLSCSTITVRCQQTMAFLRREAVLLHIEDRILNCSVWLCLLWSCSWESSCPYRILTTCCAHYTSEKERRSNK